MLERIFYTYTVSNICLISNFPPKSFSLGLHGSATSVLGYVQKGKPLRSFVQSLWCNVYTSWVDEALRLRATLIKACACRLRRGSELGHGLGALRHGVLGELTREHEAHRGLDLPGRKGGLLGVGGQLASFASKALEDVVDERVHDRHTLLGDASVRVHLLEHLVDVRGVRLDALLGALLAGRLLRRLGGFLGRSLSLS